MPYQLSPTTPPEHTAPLPHWPDQRAAYHMPGGQRMEPGILHDLVPIAIALALFAGFIWLIA